MLWLPDLYGIHKETPISSTHNRTRTQIQQIQNLHLNSRLCKNETKLSDRLDCFCNYEIISFS